MKNAITAMGLSFGALSDHHNILNHVSWLKTKTIDFLPIVSKEISTSNGHVMALNVHEAAISLSENMIEHISLFDTMEIWNGSIPMMSGTTNDHAFHL